MKPFYLLCMLAVAGTTLESTAKPLRVPSFGPNGTHWPGQITGLATPYMYDETVPNRIEVACSWAAINTAVSELSANQVSEGVLILVQPGTLVGAGGGNASPSDLENIGNKSWSKRVTIAPRDGWGSVNVSGGVKFNKIRNICWAGFRMSGGLRIVSSTRFAIARCVIDGYMVAFGKMTDETDYRQWEFVEVVKRVVNAPKDEDVFQLQVPQSGATDHVYETILDGCYFAPNYMNIGATAHQDTIQHLASGSFFFKNGTIQDTVVFASNRCAVNGGLIDTTFRNCWLNSRKSTQISRYPVPDGAAMRDDAGVSQGSKSGITFDGGYVMGSLQSNQGISPTPYPTVMNGATIDYRPSGYVVPTSGAWLVDSTIRDTSHPKYPTLPTDTYLWSIWSKNATIPSPSLPVGDPVNPSVPTGLRVVLNATE